jgi:hypothetical protein
VPVQAEGAVPTFRLRFISGMISHKDLLGTN